MIRKQIRKRPACVPLPRMDDLDWHALIINATRYAVSRNTYASSEMADIIFYNAEYLSPKTRSILIRDFEAELERGAISQTDLPAWKVALESLKEAQK